MALDIVKLYVSLISDFFTLSDMSVSSSSGGRTPAPSPLLPGTTSHALSTAHFLMKILGEIQELVNEVTGMEISPELASVEMKNFLESVKWRFIELVVAAWQRGSAFYTLFFWTSR